MGGQVSSGRNGILSYLAGRLIDYNHPMAGRTLKYNYRVYPLLMTRKKSEGIAEIVTGLDTLKWNLMEMTFPLQSQQMLLIQMQP